MTHQTLSSSSSEVPPPPDPLPVHFLLQKAYMVISHTEMLWQVNDLDKATLFRIMLKILVKFYQQSPMSVSSPILRCVYVKLTASFK